MTAPLPCTALVAIQLEDAGRASLTVAAAPRSISLNASDPNLLRNHRPDAALVIYGVSMDLDPTEYHRLAALHRPTDDAVLAANVRDLAAQGLTERDIGVALRISVVAVRSLLTARGSEAAAIHAAAWTSPSSAAERVEL